MLKFVVTHNPYIISHADDKVKTLTLIYIIFSYSRSISYRINSLVRRYANITQSFKLFPRFIADLIDSAGRGGVKCLSKISRHEERSFMNSDITTDNIRRVAFRAGLEITTAEADAAAAHIKRQSENFGVLYSVNTDGVQPFFGAGAAENVVARADE